MAFQASEEQNMRNSSGLVYTSTPMGKPTWDISRSFAWNYSHGPILEKKPLEILPHQQVTLLSWKLCSPLGVAAGPLPNAQFVKTYARLGYSLITYKSVRSRVQDAHPKPVLTRLRSACYEDPAFSTPLVVDNDTSLSSFSELSSANSVGIPSSSPEQWREDVRQARESLDQGQVLVVSVVGTPEAGDTVEWLANDFACCAQWAAEAGADMIELNLSCPNVQSREGDVYLDPTTSSLIVEATRAAVGRIPLSAKLGYYPDRKLMFAVLESITPFLNALTLINSIRLRVITPSGSSYFPGAGREHAGVGGAAIRMLAQDNVRDTIEFLRKRGLSIPVIAVGGVTEPYHVDEYLSLGATAVTIATAAIWRPFFPYDYAQFRSEHTQS
jgi:dihydroorotate dehydrogenase (NAD+) catalytic subunit